MARRPKPPKDRDLYEALKAVQVDLADNQHLHRGATLREIDTWIRLRHPVVDQQQRYADWYAAQPHEPPMKIWRLSYINNRPWATLAMTLGLTAAAAYFIHTNINNAIEAAANGGWFMFVLCQLVIGVWIVMPLGWWRGLIAQAKVHLDPHAINNRTAQALQLAQAQADEYDAARRHEDGH
jgi:hypothetical protein